MKKLLYLLCLISVFACKENNSSDVLSESFNVRNNGADMPVHVHGNANSKSIIIIIHGGPGGNGLEYRSGQYAEELESKYAIAYWDQRGQGMSQGKYKDITVDMMVEDLYSVIQVIKHKYGQDKSIFLLGHSWGGMLGTAFMLTKDYQQEVAGWIEADGAHDIPRLNKSAIKMFIKVGNDQIDEGNSVDQWSTWVKWAEAVDTNSISQEVGGEINSNGFEAESVLTNDGEMSEGPSSSSMGNTTGPINKATSFFSGNSTNKQLMAEVENKSLTNELHRITRPCLFLWGRYDFVVPPQLGLDALNLVGTEHKSMVVFEKSGHSPMNNEPAKFVGEVVNFISQYE